MNCRHSYHSKPLIDNAVSLMYDHYGEETEVEE